LKYTIILLTLLTVIGCVRNNKDLNKKEVFEVTYTTGCGGMTTSKILIYKNENTYYADHISPSYYDGEKVHSVLTVKLDSNQIQSCFMFLNKAKSLPARCLPLATIVIHYIIIEQGDTIDINGDCDWENLNYKYLDQTLFKAKHDEISRKKEKVTKTLISKLKGKWFLQPLNGELKRNDIITFHRKNVTQDFVEFGNKDTLTGIWNDLVGKKDLKRYTIEISDSEEATTLTLDWGKIILKKDYITVYKHNARFVLNSIDNNEFKLKYLWSD